MGIFKKIKKAVLGSTHDKSPNAVLRLKSYAEGLTDEELIRFMRYSHVYCDCDVIGQELLRRIKQIGDK